MSKRFIWLLASLVLIPALACSGGNKDKKSTEQPVATQTGGQTSPTQPAVASPSGGNTAAGNEVAALLTNFAKVKSFRASISVEAPGQAKQEGTMEYVAPDRYHITVGGLGEFISIGSDYYAKIGPNWTKISGGGLGAVFSTADLSDSLKEIQQAGVQKAGTDTVAGKRCQIYTYSQNGGTSEVCVADGLPVRIQMKTGGATTTIIFTDYDKSIDIKAPI